MCLGVGGAQPAVVEAARPALAAITDHLALLALLRGDRPRGLLPAVPTAYMLERIHALAAGSFLGQFMWDGERTRVALWAPFAKGGRVCTKSASPY